MANIIARNLGSYALVSLRLRFFALMVGSANPSGLPARQPARRQTAGRAGGNPARFTEQKH